MIEVIFGSAEYDQPKVYEAGYIPAACCEMEMAHSDLIRRSLRRSLLRGASLPGLLAKAQGPDVRQQMLFAVPGNRTCRRKNGGMKVSSTVICRAFFSGARPEDRVVGGIDFNLDVKKAGVFSSRAC